MICQRCLKYQRTCDGLKSETSRSHAKCAKECPQDLAEAGDRNRLSQWKCAMCHKFVTKDDPGCTNNPKENLINAINIITEKFEVVNKIQLPKINSELTHVKSITEHIVKQNENILRRICDLENKKKSLDSRPGNSGETPLGYRTRNVNLSTAKTKHEKCREDDHAPILPLNEKYGARYRTRRPYIINRMFRLLNRHRNYRTRTPRKNI
ncbi:hypothetical protein O0L34_g2620 [Tuta absoluta]|nr:hypothetical protein O0L34_g2620 [Tuta absoluta]